MNIVCLSPLRLFVLPSIFQSIPYFSKRKKEQLTYKPPSIFKHKKTLQSNKMSSAEAQVVYNRGSFSEPMEVQEGFAKQFDLSRPEIAMDSYQRLVNAWPTLDMHYIMLTIVTESCTSTRSNNSKRRQPRHDDDRRPGIAIWYRCHPTRAVDPLVRPLRRPTHGTKLLYFYHKDGAGLNHLSDMSDEHGVALVVPSRDQGFDEATLLIICDV